MKQSIDAFMDKLLEQNTSKRGAAALSATEKVGAKMEKAVKELTEKYEDQEQPAGASEPDEEELSGTGADGGDPEDNDDPGNDDNEE